MNREIFEPEHDALRASLRAWLDKGAQPTAQVRKLLRTQGIEA